MLHKQLFIILIAATALLAASEPAQNSTESQLTWRNRVYNRTQGLEQIMLDNSQNIKDATITTIDSLYLFIVLIAMRKDILHDKNAAVTFKDTASITLLLSLASLANLVLLLSHTALIKEAAFIYMPSVNALKATLYNLIGNNPTTINHIFATMWGTLFFMFSRIAPFIITLLHEEADSFTMKQSLVIGIIAGIASHLLIFPLHAALPEYLYDGTLFMLKATKNYVGAESLPEKA